MDLQTRYQDRLALTHEWIDLMVYTSDRIEGVPSTTPSYALVHVVPPHLLINLELTQMEITRGL